MEDDLAKTSPAAVDSAREFSAQRSKLCEVSGRVEVLNIAALILCHVLRRVA